jgi:RNA polymerase sigma factor (sigma-70 family)
MTDAFEQMSPEVLVRRTAWLDSLARELVNDPHHAQDVVQDAWLAALQHRASIGQLGPWLAQVVRHLASRQRNREAGRAQRESAAARGESEPSTLDIVVRVQQQHRVVAAVLALDEPYRATVLMRFFDALPPRAIAERMGVPVATVRTRLSRALDRLRAALDDESGSRRAWVLPLTSGLTAPPAAAALITGVLMNSKLGSGLGLAALGLLATALWFALPARQSDTAPPAPDPEFTPRSVALAATAVPPATVLAEGAEERLVVADPTPAPVPQPDALVALTGIVVDGAERPIEGAAVAVLEPLGASFNLLSESGEVEERGQETTGADGRFALPVPFARVQRLEVSAANCATRTLEPCYGGQDYTIALEPAASLTGRITDATTGVPVSGVALFGAFDENRSERVTGVSGDDGTFVLDGLPAGTLSIDVLPQHHEAQLRREVVLRGGETAHLDVVLQRGGTVFGTVTDAASGQPIAGAEISAGWTFQKVVRTDVAGSYRMGGAPGPGVPDMYVRAGGYALAVKEVRGNGEQRVDFALRRGGSVRGRIVDGNGAPKAGVYVAADADLGVVNGIGHNDWRHARSGADGMFRITGLVPDAQYALLVRHRGWATLAFQLPGAVDPDKAMDVGDLQLEPPAVLVGRVVDAESRGIADAGVDLTGTNDDYDRMLALRQGGERRVPYHVSNRQVRTDREGWFRIADLAGGTYDVSVSVRGGPRGGFEDLRVEPGRTTAGVEIRVDLGRELAGTVVTDDGTPLPTAHLSVRIHRDDQTGQMERFVLVDRDGSFHALGLADAPYRLEVSASHWANDGPALWLGSAVRDVPAGSRDVRLVLHRAVDITGRVVDSQGRPRKGIAVVAVRDGEVDDAARDSTGDDGAFLLRVLPGTVWTLRYGEAAPSLPGLAPVHLPSVRTAKECPGVRAGTTGLELVIE